MNLTDQNALRNFALLSKSQTIQYATLQLLETMGITVQVIGEPPKKGPVLLISNHPGGNDSLVIFASISRKDFFSVALANYQRLSTTFAKRILPIYRKRLLRDFIVEISGDFKGHIIDDQKEVQERNRKSITRAAELISEGHMVVIYPTGTGGKTSKNGKWKAGVGFLAKQIINPKTKIVFVHISGTKKSDILRYTHPKLRNLLFTHKQVRVIFSQPHILSELVDIEKDGKEIATKLESHYNQYFKFRTFAPAFAPVG